MSGFVEGSEYRFEKRGVLNDCKIQGADKSQDRNAKLRFEDFLNSHTKLVVT